MSPDEIGALRGGQWAEGSPAAALGWCANQIGRGSSQIGYACLLACLVAGFLIGYAPWLAAGMLLGSNLLCSMLVRSKSGVERFADVMARLMMAGWLVTVRPAMLPWIAIATGIVFCNGLFDFAAAATKRSSFAVLGRALRWAWPLCQLAFCLRVDIAGWVLFAPAFLYLCSEGAELVSTIGIHGRPYPAYDDGPAGFRLCGVVSGEERDLLIRTSRDAFERTASECAASTKAGRIFWINMWQRSGGGEKMPVGRADELDAWCRKIAGELYAGEDAELDGYGLIINPVGSSGQEWHIDYTPDYSTTFIPMTRCTPLNAPQYVVFPGGPRELPDPDCVDFAAIADALPWISVRQLIAPEWSLLRMDFGTIHRGIANMGADDRTMFWISVKRRGELLPPEPLLQTIDGPDVDQPAPAPR